VWSYDFVMDRTSDGRPIRMLMIVDEHTRECLAINVAKKLTSEDVLERLSDLFVRRGVPEHIRSDKGSEFTTKCVRKRLGRVGVKTLDIEPGSPWENGYVESFNGKLRDELLKRESFVTLLEAKVLIERWTQASNTVRPHRAGLSEGEPLTSKLVPHWGAGHVPHLSHEHWYKNWGGVNRRPQRFLESTSCSVFLSRLRSATNCFSFLFSSSKV